MATNGDEDLADFLKREEAKFSELGDSALRSSPPPDFDAMMDAKEREENESQALSVAIANSIELSSYDEPPVVTIQRRSSPTMVRRPSVEAITIQLSDTSLLQDTSGPQETGESVFSVEPECIQNWRRDKEEMLEQKEAAASEEMRRLREAAQQEMRDWYDHHNSQVETRKQDNRAAEDGFVQERDQSVPGTEWEKVANLCDFSAKGAGKNSRDVSRMRSIFLHLKENPPVKK